MKRYIISGEFKNSAEEILWLDSEQVRIKFLNSRNKLQFGIDDQLKKMNKMGIMPSEIGLDTLVLGMMVYLADTRISRELEAQDSWTREIVLDVPVSDKLKWNPCIKVLTKMLNFLTGDRWTLKFSNRDIEITDIKNYYDENVEEEQFETVSLFSGGMDSLISTINLLEDKIRPLLITHSCDKFDTKTQFEVFDFLSDNYKDIDPKHFYTWLSFDKNIISKSIPETTTRGRSFLFIALSVFAISGMTHAKEIKVPENGLIAINVPLDFLRLGSLSTKTTHPYYLHGWNELVMKLGLDITIINEYQFKTKGEMACDCKNADRLKEILPFSVSCSSSHKTLRAGEGKRQQCGYCVPCIIRRAAINKYIGVDNDATTYRYSEISSIINMHETAKGQQLRSFQVAIENLKKNPHSARLLINKSGPLPMADAEREELANMYRRGLEEVENFIVNGLNED